MRAALTAVLSLDPGAAALEFKRVWRSWGEVAATIDSVEGLLEAMAFPAGGRVGVLLRNDADIACALMAVLRSERCLVSFNSQAPENKLQTDFAAAEVPVLIATAADWARPGLQTAAQNHGTAAIAVENGVTRTLLAGLPASWTRPSAPGIAIEMLTSGTTGSPKRIPLARRNFDQALAGAASFERDRSAHSAPRLRGGVQIVSAPLCHIAGIFGLMNNILSGRKVCLLEKFTVEDFREAVVRHRPKVAGAPPAALRMLLDANIPREDFSSLVAYRTGTAPLDPVLADEFYERYGVPVLQNYGATEFAGGVAGWTIEEFKEFWRAKRGAVGRLNRGIEGRVVDPDTGEVLAVGAEGLLELRGANIDDGVSWVRTTDLAVFDADAFLWIRGRHDGAIIRGGFKVLPGDIQQVLHQHPAVLEAAVVGISDRRLGQVPVAAWIGRAGADVPSESELRDWLRERLVPYQVPVRIRQVDELPRTPSMKISLPALRAMFESNSDPATAF
jgi:acyl-CoA synthetase (AMP-forming)/AMP-acid ligase II